MNEMQAIEMSDETFNELVMQVLSAYRIDGNNYVGIMAMRNIKTPTYVLSTSAFCSPATFNHGQFHAAMVHLVKRLQDRMIKLTFDGIGEHVQLHPVVVTVQRLDANELTIRVSDDVFEKISKDVINLGGLGYATFTRFKTVNNDKAFAIDVGYKFGTTITDPVIMLGLETLGRELKAKHAHETPPLTCHVIHKLRVVNPNMAPGPQGLRPASLPGSAAPSPMRPTVARMLPIGGASTSAPRPAAVPAAVPVAVPAAVPVTVSETTTVAGGPGAPAAMEADAAAGGGRTQEEQTEAIKAVISHLLLCRSLVSRVVSHHAEKLSPDDRTRVLQVMHALIRELQQ